MSETFLDLGARIAAHAAARPDAIAAKCGSEARSWAVLTGRMNRAANALIALGVKPCDKVAMLGENSLSQLETYLGALRAGACAVPLSSMATAEQLEAMIADCDARVLCVSAKMRDMVAPFAGRLQQLLPGGLIAYDFAAPGWRPYAEWIEAAADNAPGVPVTLEHHFNIIYSSGTTGMPKGILHSHRMRDYQFERMHAYGFAPGKVTLASTPLYSNTTLTTLLPSLAHGATVVMMPKFDVEEFLRLSEAERVTHAILVPVQYQRILAHEAFNRFDLAAYEVKLSTSAPLRPGLKRQILDRWPGNLVEIYGLTEGGATCILNCREHPHKLDTVGMPSPGVEIRILDEHGNELPAGQIGEVAGRAPTMMNGYYKRHEQTEALHWRDKDGNLFFKTGDLGRFDEDGFLHLLDRKKDMIISGGFNIYAADLEAVLARHADVADVAVIGVPSERWGESPLALVVKRGGASIEAEALREWANGQVGKLQRLAAVEFRDTLPRSTIGKVLKRELREPYWRGK